MPLSGNTRADLQAMLAQVVTLAQADRIDEAEALLKRLLAAAPVQPDALQLMGLVAGRRGRHADAVGWFRKSLAVHPAQPHVHNNLGNTLVDLGRIGEAVRAYREAVRLQPDYVDAWINLGLAHAAAGEHEEALQAYDRALRIAPDSNRALNGKGVSLKALGRLEESESVLAGIVLRSPRDLRALNNLGNVLRELGRHEEAIACYRRAIDLAPRTSRLRIALAGTCFDLGRFEESEALLEEVLAEEPANTEALEDLKSVRFSTGKADAVAEGYERSLANAPRALPVWRAYAEAMWQMERHEEGIAIVDRAVRACGAQPVLDFWRARLMASKGEAAAALDLLDPAMEGAQGLGAHSIAVERARVHLRLGSFAEGARELEEETVADPDDYTLWAHLEALWRLAGDGRSAWLMDYERFARPLELPLPAGYPSHAAFNEALAETLTELHVTRVHPVDQTLRGGTQTFGRLFHRSEPVIRALREALREAVRAYAADLPSDPDHPFLKHRGQDIRFSGSWSVRLRSEGYHVPHYHPQGWISSAFYVALPPSVADPATRAGRLEFGIPPVPVPVEVRPAKEIQPRPGLLALFPSYCWHGTVPFSDAEPRLTVAFDVARGSHSGPLRYQPETA